MENLKTTTKKLVLDATKRFGTAFEHESGYWLPADQVEEYVVSYEGVLIATFWVSNNYEDSIHLHHPVDVKILQYILDLQKTRSFKRNV